MSDTALLVVEQGPDQGREIAVPPAGIRVGRSPKSDLILKDPLVSRHHCRLFLKPGEGLWVADLASANQTLVNDRPVQECALRANDRLTVGDTVLRVVDDGTAQAAPPPPPPVDLGLRRDRTPPARQRPSAAFVAALLVLVAAVAVVALAPKWRRKPAPPVPAPAVVRPVDWFEADYEKVQAGSNGIFRYHLLIATDRTVSVEIDDTAQTHVREQGKADPAVVDDLARFIEEAGFFSLAEDYKGIRPDVHDQYDLMVTLGRKTHRVTVLNRVPPPAFEEVREKLEAFGHVELGLWAVQYPPEKLMEMGREAFLLGRKLYAERDVAHGNLARALKSFGEAEFTLKTVEPKPDFYGDLLGGMRECREEIDRRYQDRIFLAERATRMKSWEEAARELRTILELLPDADPRKEEVRKKLIEVENRMKRRN